MSRGCPSAGVWPPCSLGGTLPHRHSAGEEPLAGRFCDGVSDAELGRHVLSDGNYLWHLFSWNLVPCLSGDAARQALSEASGEKYLFYYEEPPEGEPLVRPVTAEELVTLPADARAFPERTGTW